MELKLKRFLAIVLIAALAISGLVLGQTEAVQAEETDPRLFLEVTKEIFSQYIEDHTAPTYDGYLFAGWLSVPAEGEAKPIKTTDDAKDGNKIVAKFIPQHLAGVSCQISQGTYGDNGEVAKDSTNFRAVSLVDKGEYQGFGFNLYRRTPIGNGYEEKLFCKYDASQSGSVDANGNPAAGQSTTRYSGLYAGKDLKTPADIFGADAKDFYFTTVSITGVPSSFFDTCIFVIKPYWITADGTYVEGLGEYDRVSDGKNGIVNISVNIKQAQAIAAGLVTVNYDQSKFEYQGADIGRVFEEMTFANNDGSISCIGNVADMNGNSLNPNDIFVNLRFTKKNDVTVGTAEFTIDSKAFSNNQEELTDANVLNAKY